MTCECAICRKHELCFYISINLPASYLKVPCLLQGVHHICADHEHEGIAEIIETMILGK